MAEPQPERERLDGFRQALLGLLFGARQTGGVVDDKAFLTLYAGAVAAARNMFYDDDEHQAIQEEIRGLDSLPIVVKISPN